MNEKDGKTNRIPITSTSNILNAPHIKIPLDQLKDKIHRGELTMKDILDNDDSINDLRTNPISPYKEMITSDNIKLLIDYCLKFNKELKESSQKDLRYPYYSSQILCSSCVLLFKQSISNIRHSNSLIINKNKLIDNEMDNKVNNSNFLNEKLESNKSNNKENDINKIKNNDFLYESSIQSYSAFPNDGNSSNFVNDYENEIDEKYVDSYKNLTETDFKISSKNNKISIKYNDEEMKIIKDILNYIFDILNYQKDDKIFNENLAYLGYFKNLVNYLLINETDIMIEYLFGDSIPVIDKFYSHLNNTSIQIILENLLNLLSDKEDNKYKNKYNDIIIKLIQILSEDINNDNFENSEFICELIINTLVNNSENQLIDLIINNNRIMKKIKNIIENIVNKNNEKVLTNILKVLFQINNIILISLNESLYNKIPYIINDHNKLNIFEYQHFSTKMISYKNIFEAFKNNIFSYLFISEEIYKLISKDIKQKYINNFNQDINNFKNINSNNKDRRLFGLHNIYKWKFILSAIKVYIYSYNVNDELKNNKYFDDKELLLISINLYFIFPQNNIYQNIFHEIIKLICLEECPGYLVEPFLIINDEEKQNKFIFNLLNNMKINKDEKYNLTNGIDLEILNLFYSSNNKAILNHFEKSDLDKKCKIIFNKESIKIKFDRQLNEDYEYSKDEIFDIERDKDDTFDDNDYEVKEFLYFKNIISNFLDKIEEEKKRSFNKVNKEKNNNNQLNKMDKKKENEIQKENIIDKSSYNIGDTNYVKEEKKTITKKNDNSLEIDVKYSLKEKEK